MAKMWAGRTDGMTEKIADDFNSSIRFDSRMYQEDITGSMAHAAMLSYKGIISQADADSLIAGLDRFWPISTAAFSPSTWSARISICSWSRC